MTDDTLERTRALVLAILEAERQGRRAQSIALAQTALMEARAEAEGLMTYQPPTGEEVKALLAEMEIGPDDAAELLCCSRRAVEHWMYGKRNMPFPMLYTLAGRADCYDLKPETWREQLEGA